MKSKINDFTLPAPVRAFIPSEKSGDLYGRQEPERGDGETRVAPSERMVFSLPASASMGFHGGRRNNMVAKTQHLKPRTRFWYTLLNLIEREIYLASGKKKKHWSGQCVMNTILILVEKELLHLLLFLLY